MLRITASQMNAFSDLEVEKFRERILRLLRESFAATSSMSDEELKKVIDNGIRSCERLGIETTREMSLYVGIGIALGHEPVETDPGRQILMQDGLAGSTKILQLYEWACERLLSLENERS